MNVPLEDWNDVAELLSALTISMTPSLYNEIERLRRKPFDKRFRVDCTCGERTEGGAIIPCLIHDQLPLLP
jgi:hypothetical protein